jgi:hypothetical protein
MGGVFNNKESFGKVTVEGIVSVWGTVRNKECLSEGSAKDNIKGVSVRE